MSETEETLYFMNKNDNNLHLYPSETIKDSIFCEMFTRCHESVSPRI